MILIEKVRSVKTPERGTPGSAGIDFFVPDHFPPCILYPGESILIPSGIICKIPEGTALIAENKSGIATKKNLYVGAKVVDQDYQGEIHIHLYNGGMELQTIEKGMKIIQFLLVPVLFPEVKEVLSAWGENKTERGTGGFGSTNRLKESSEQIQRNIQNKENF